MRHLLARFMRRRAPPPTGAPVGPPPVEAGRIADSAAYWDVHNVAPPEDVRYWLAVPEIRREVNRWLTGDPERLFIARFLEETVARAGPVRRALSVGCGTGELERGVVGEGFVETIDGIDVSPASLAAAQRAAGEAGLSARIAYHAADAASWLAGCEAGAYGLVFFHGSLHHVEDLEEVLDGTARTLRGGEPGLVYVDEYVGPSRDEWHDRHLAAARELFSRVPPELRRTPAVFPPVALDDPTEMIRSSEIRRLLGERFDLVAERPYYGNVLMPLVAAIRGSALGDPRVQESLREGLRQEAGLLRSGAPGSLYSIFVGRPMSR